MLLDHPAVDADAVLEAGALKDIILGQLRLVIATLTIEEINRDREKFMSQINENVGQEINKVGLDLINVNIRALTDLSLRFARLAACRSLRAGPPRQQRGHRPQHA